LGAANATYNSQLANVNAQNAGMGNLTNGLFGLGAAAIGSDRNIKENITELFQRDDGLKVYEFEYKPKYKEAWGDGKHVGVMAQDVEKLYPHAVSVHPDGYKLVNYGALA